MENENTNLMETAEDISKTIAELQLKLQKAQANELGEGVEAIEIPLAKGFLRLSKFTSVPIRNMTPAEIAILVAEHHKNAGGMPIERLELQKDVEGMRTVYVDDGEGGEKPIRKTVLIERAKYKVDPRVERARLSAKYRASKVTALFPGLVPTFPKSFASAMQAGLATNLPEERMMDFNLVEPAAA